MRSITHQALCAVGAMFFSLGALAGIDIPIGPTDSIQETINTAPNGSRILLGAGVYTQRFTILETGKELTLEGAGPGVTILDGNNVRRIGLIENNAAPVTIRGMTFRNARQEGNGDRFGAALTSLETALTIEQCVFVDNIVRRTSDGGEAGGGALYVSSQIDPSLALRIADCLFLNNEASGAPMAMSTPMEVQAGAAGIVWIGDARIVRCRFEGNRAVNPDGFARAGALRSLGAEAERFAYESCEFISNSAESNTIATGGAVLVAKARMINCLFEGNGALTPPSALFAAGGAIWSVSGGVELELLHCTITNNTAASAEGKFGSFGGGIAILQLSSPDEISMTNTIVAGNTASEGPDVQGPLFNVRYSLIGDITGALITGENEGNLIGVDPMFVDASGADFRLAPGSPCIDAADTVATYFAPLAADLAGEMRAVIDPNTTNTGVEMLTFFGLAASDIGAYEFQPPTPPANSCPADLTGDGQVGSSDLAQVLSSWGACP